MRNDTIFAMGGGLHGAKVTTAAEILEKSGINFEVEARPIYMQSGNTMVQVEGKRAIVRKDTGHVFNVMSDSYKIVQPAAALDLLDDAAGKGACIYTSAGSLRNDSRVFVTARLPDEIRIGKEDVIKPYLGVFNSFDGTSPVIIKALSFRPICANTYAHALATEHDQEFVVKHTTHADARMRVAMNTLAAAGYTFRKLGATFQALAATRFTDRDMADLAKVLIPAKDEENVSAQTKDTRDVLVTLFEQGRGQREFADVRGTAWAAFNAVTEYVDHLRPTRGDDETEGARSPPCSGPARSSKIARSSTCRPGSPGSSRARGRGRGLAPPLDLTPLRRLNHGHPQEPPCDVPVQHSRHCGPPGRE